MQKISLASDSGKITLCVADVDLDVVVDGGDDAVFCCASPGVLKKVRASEDPVTVLLEGSQYESAILCVPW